MLRQQKLCEIWDCPRPEPKTILDLPKHVRRRIYLHCGLVTRQKILLAPSAALSNPHGRCIPTDFNLFCTCKAIRDETRAIFFAENHFTIPYRHIDEGLKFIQRLPPKIISKLAWLCVHLHTVPTGNSWPDFLDDYYPSIFTAWHPTPLSQYRIRRWRAVAGHLMSHSPPGILNLHIVCHSLDEAVITAVLEPLTKRSGVLKDFDFHPSNTVNMDNIPPAFTRKFKLPVIFKDQRQNCTKPFRYLDLPTEIQESILANTDLVTPSREVYWDLDGKYRYHAGGADGICCSSDLHKDYEPQFCMSLQCRETSRGPSHRHRSRYGCCPQCWRPPQSLMVVSRAIREHAFRVLWRYNRVIIYPWTGYRPTGSSEPVPQQQMQLCKFITTSQASFLLRNLRSLELCLPNVAFDDPFNCSVDSDELSVSSPLTNHWITELRDYADVERLTITVNMMAHDSISRATRTLDPTPTFYKCGAKSKSVLLFSLATHMRCLQPLQLLRHMKRFFVRLEPVYVAQEVSQSHTYLPHYSSKLETILLNLRNAEVLLEKSVMGEDYDSGLLGKSEEKPSTWLQNFIVVENESISTY
ncbi:hypothetical protein F5B22DRAFT_574269 [Xylaria bambusicola]|uniref:uncharacterized protein n=1 Tax=Xylaria bambusicola TaxID=326684 RepID=UPI002008D80C|nr:uncharacterized protein F5B22DRAFT_574269 [Xylaria bambusicola]KAI0503102.1 hypothetical protein F5B22DRAFT_574269 [Xylaria bambusicola]